MVVKQIRKNRRSGNFERILGRVIHIKLESRPRATDRNLMHGDQELRFEG